MYQKIKRMLLATSVFIFSTFLLSACGGSPDTTDQSTDDHFASFTNSLHQEIKAHWPHMNKVWPTYQYDNHNLILFRLTDDGNVAEAVLLNTKEQRKLKKSEYKNITPPQDGGYEEIKFDGKPSLAMSVTQKSVDEKNSVDTFYRVATHEFVHFYYQNEAMVGVNGENRSQSFPIEKAPRLYRQMIYQNLIKAYDNPSQEQDYLGKAKYWLEKWQTEFPNEYQSIKSTDIAESIARYSDNLSTFVEADTTAAQIYKNADKDIKRNELFYSADAESYEIGFVAALILDQNTPDWKASFYQEKMTVEEKLLKDLPSMAEEMNAEIEAKVSASIEEYNTEVLSSIQDIIDAKKDKGVPYLKIDVTNSTSSMIAEEIITYEEEQITIGYSNQFAVGKKSIVIDNANVYERIDDDGNLFLYIPLQMPYELNSEVLTVASEKLEVDGIKVSAYEENGRTIYFVKANE